VACIAWFVVKRSGSAHLVFHNKTVEEVWLPGGPAIRRSGDPAV
jgi:hypothetical protein